MNKHINIFKYLILVMILTIINYPITVYADDNGDLVYEDTNGDWHYQTDENDAKYFDEMLKLEWNSKLSDSEKLLYGNNIEIYKQKRLSDLKNRVVIKYTLKQPDENGQTVVYKDYSLTSTVGDKSNGTYLENFYYETDWQRNVNSVDIWLPCTVNSSSDAPQIKNPGKEYKTITDENGKEIWDKNSGYGGNFCMGARVGEIRALQWKDFDFEAGTVYIHGYIKPYKNADGHIYEQKTNYTKAHAENGLRTIPICGEIYERFYNLYNIKNPDGEDYVFMSNGHFLNCDAYNHRLRAIADRVGIKYQSSHKIRFWYATNLFEKGVDESIIQKLMGHDNVKTTQHYNRSAKRHVAIANTEYEKLVY